jgi:hypothetical protein
MLLVAYFLRIQFSDKHAILFLLCLNASQTVLHQSIEIRSYSWAFFFVVMTGILAFYCLRSGKNKHWLFFIFFAECCAYTHYHAAIIAAIIYLLIIAYLVINHRIRLIKVIAMVAFAILLYIPGLIVLFIQIRSGMMNNVSAWIPRPNTSIIKHFIYYPFSTGFYQASGIFFLLFIIPSIIFIVKNLYKIFYLKKTDLNDIYYLILSISPFIYFIFLLIFSLLIRPIIYDRYLYMSFGLVYLSFIISANNVYKGRIYLLVCIILFGIGFLSFSSKFNIEHIQNEGYKNTQYFWRENIKPEDAIIYTKDINGHVPIVISYLFPEYKNIYGNNNRNIYSPQAFSYEDFLFNKDKFKNVWIIGNRDSDILTDEQTTMRSELWEDWYYFNIYYTTVPEIVLSKW